jgi:hypothetical protein
MRRTINVVTIWITPVRGSGLSGGQKNRLTFLGGAILGKMKANVCSYRDTFKSYLLISQVRPLKAALRDNRLEDLRFGSVPLHEELKSLWPKERRAHYVVRPYPRGADQDYCVVAGRDALEFAENDRRKNRKSHFSQRNGLTRIMAKISCSTIPLRLERWIRLLWHSGQLIIAFLLMRHLHCRVMFG